MAICTDLVFVILAAWAVRTCLGLHLTSALGHVNVAYRMNLAAPLFALLLFGMASTPSSSIAARLLGSRLFQELGKVSYGIYLWGWAVMMKYNLHLKCNNEPPDLVRWLLFFGWLLLSGMLSFYLIEEPFQKLSKRIM